jgi:hypothetical protein
MKKAASNAKIAEIQNADNVLIATQHTLST